MTDIHVVFSTSQRLLPRLIRRVSKGTVSHCSIWMSICGVPMVWHATVGGVKLELAAEWLKHSQVVKKFKPLVDVSDGLAEAVQLLNVGYDYLGLFGFIPVMIGRWLKKKIKNPLASPTRVVCSEFVLRLDAYDKIPEWNDFEWESTDPQQLMASCGASFVEVP